MPAGQPSHRLVFADGAYRADLSSVGTLPAGAVVTSLGEALASQAGLLERYLGKVGVTDSNPFQALNTAFLADGLVVHVPKGVTVPEPIEVVFVGSGLNAPGRMAGLYALPGRFDDASCDWIKVMLGSHVRIGGILAERGTPLAALPFSSRHSTSAPRVQLM